MMANLHVVSVAEVAMRDCITSMMTMMTTMETMIIIKNSVVKIRDKKSIYIARKSHTHPYILTQ